MNGVATRFVGTFVLSLTLLCAPAHARASREAREAAKCHASAMSTAISFQNDVSQRDLNRRRVAFWDNEMVRLVPNAVEREALFKREREAFWSRTMRAGFMGKFAILGETNIACDAVARQDFASPPPAASTTP